MQSRLDLQQSKRCGHRFLLNTQHLTQVLAGLFQIDMPLGACSFELRKFRFQFGRGCLGIDCFLKRFRLRTSLLRAAKPSGRTAKLLTTFRSGTFIALRRSSPVRPGVAHGRVSTCRRTRGWTESGHAASVASGATRFHYFGDPFRNNLPFRVVFQVQRGARSFVRGPPAGGVGRDVAAGARSASAVDGHRA